MSRNGLCSAVVRTALLVLATYACAQEQLQADDALRPAWTCLPNTTFFVARLPSLTAFGDALADGTRLGAAWNDSQRWRSALDEFCRRHDAAWEDVEHALATHDLKLEDWRALTSGEMGWACTGGIDGAAGSGIFWVEPQAELADRVWKWLDTWTRDLADQPEFKRNDETVADVPVIQVSGPIFEWIGHGTLRLGAGFTFSQGLDWTIGIKRDAEATKTGITGSYYGRVFAARQGRRIIIVHTLPSQCEDEDGNPMMSEETAKPHFTTMANILEAHNRDGEVAAWLRNAVAQAPRDGTPLYEVFCDLGSLAGAFLNLFNEAMHDPDEPLDAITQSLSDLFTKTVGGIGTLTVRNAIHSNRGELVVQLELPAPRSGLLALFDAPPLPVEPVPWTPTSAGMYSQIEVDVAPITESLTTTLRTLRADEEFEAFAALEKALKVDFAELLGGLGPRLVWISFNNGTTKPSTSGKGGPLGAVAWQVRNDAAWQRLFECVASTFGYKSLRQDGYVGFDIEIPDWGGPPWHLMAGHGHLILNGAADPTAPPISLIDQPQADGDARSNGAYQRAVELLPGGAAFSFAFSDWRSTEATTRWLADLPRRIVDLSLVPSGDDSKERSRVTDEFAKSWWHALLGDAADESLIGVSASRTDIDPRGLTYRAVLELTPTK